MIMGDTCTRACTFCNVKTGLPGPLDPGEPSRVADATAKLQLKHVVVTSVDRDDLADGGGGHFAAVIGAIRAQCPATTIEVLTPDFLRKAGAVEMVVSAKPDVFNHNLETVPSNYLHRAAGRTLLRFDTLVAAGQGDRSDDLHQVRASWSAWASSGTSCSRSWMICVRRMSTSSPSASICSRRASTTRSNATCHPDEFKAYETIAYAKGFLMVSSSPLTRSSHHAGEDFARLKAAREAKLGGV